MPVIPQLRRLSLTTVAAVALALVAPGASVADPAGHAPTPTDRVTSVRAPAVRVHDVEVRQSAPTSVADVRVRFRVRNVTARRADVTDAGVLLVRSGRTTSVGRTEVPALGAQRSARVRTVVVPAVDLAAGRYRVRVCPGRATSGPGCATTARPAITIDPAGLAAAPAGLAFASTAVGGVSAGQDVVVTNRGGTSSGALSVDVSGAAAGDFAVDPAGCAAALAPGESCTITATFAPTAPGTRQAQVAVTGTAASPLVVDLDGTAVRAAQLTLTPTSGGFGAVFVGSGSTRTYTVTNDGDVTTGAPTATVTGTAFSVSSSTCETPLPAGATCQVVVRFQPQAAGVQTGLLSVVAAPGGTVTSALDGEGVMPAPPVPSGPASPLEVSIDHYDFVAPLGDYSDPAAGTELTVTNTGDEVVDMPLPTFATVGFFYVDSVRGMCGDSREGVVSLAPGESCLVRVQALASSRQTEADTLTIGDVANAVSVPFTVRGVPSDGPNLEIDGPSHVDLGRDLEDDVVRTFTLVNPGGEATGALTLGVFIEDGAGLSLDPDPEAEDACAADQVLEPGESCTFRVRFSPYLPGDYVGIVGAGVFSGDDHPLQTAVRITANAATPPPTVLSAPTALLFAIGGRPYDYQTFDLENDTDADIEVAQVDLRDGTNFRSPDFDDCTGDDGTVVVPAHGSCSVGILFVPRAGAWQTTLRLLDGAGGLLARIELVARG